jgi:hypothetical protein
MLLKMSRRRVLQKNLDLKTDNLKKLKKNIHFITYGDEKYERSKKRLLNEAKIFFDFKTYDAYGKNDLDSEFKEKYSDILKQNRGGGYWIWKPYLILKKLKEIDEGDYLLYLDAGFSINPKGFDRFVEYIDMLNNCDKPFLGFKMSHHLEKWWTTDKVFEYFNVMQNSNIKDEGQVISGFILMKKCDFTLKILEKWYKVVEDDAYLFTDKYECKRQDFRENRHDQSSLSVIGKLEGGIFLEDETWWEPPFGTGFGRGKSLSYPFWATRKK